MENVLQSPIDVSGEEVNKAELRKFIHIKGARSNNLKDIELFIAKHT